MIGGNMDLFKVKKIWEKFITTGDLDDSLDSDIASSWLRSKNAAVDPYGGVCNNILPQEKVAALIRRHRHMIDIARPFMTNLYRFVKGSGFIVMLTDNEGYILETFGDSQTLFQASDLNFIPGALWTEEEVGTNAIGMALVLSKPIQTSAAEHYCQKHHSWTCSAAPILDENGMLLGILDLSGPSEMTHLHSLGMVVAAVEAIQEQMKVQRKNHELKVANIRLKNVIKIMSDGVITLDYRGVITGINPVAKEIIGYETGKIMGNHIKELVRDEVVSRLLSNNEPYNDVEVLLSTDENKTYCLSSGTPITDDNGEIDSAVIFLRPAQKMQKLVNRYSGAQASFHFKDIIGTSEEITNILKLASAAAGGIYNVLLEGESGTGKEIFAQSIHNRGLRRRGPFVAVNCGAIPRELIASELFGYVEGAFTGARRGGRPGKFELASGGTLFLDEIGDMPLDQQVTLLRVLQDKKVVRIGGDKVTAVDVRIICATNKNLEEEVEKGNFRRDLFYRLNVVSIRIPPLRERREDIPLLFNYFKAKIATEWNVSFKSVDNEAMTLLKQYDWPGNVRELQNIVERIMSTVESDAITAEHLLSLLPGQNLNQPSHRSIKTGEAVCRQNRKKVKALAEREHIMDLLTQHGGNVSQVAREMGVSRNTLYRKMHDYSIRN
ncbi:MAG TPA: sigma-54-dependent Fis family transcriptional regulator [Syntrophomonas sp.]|jgi:PAS domain S-box-containing protein|nr:sigma-54-dependent Fis family transcriptional regulator [Syntrophomonas sp.]